MRKMCKNWGGGDHVSNCHIFKEPHKVYFPVIHPNVIDNATDTKSDL